MPEPDPIPDAERPRWWARRRVVVRDDSMGPTLLPGDRLIVDTAALRRRPPRVGELVVVRDPTLPRRWLVKRVAAVGPGPGTPADPPDGTVFLLGDARDRSRDSRTFGPVPIGAIVGRVDRCYAPSERRRSF